MALSMLAGGAECGSSNPLQGLSKRFDQDRGLQQDHFGAGRAGSSRESFRTRVSPANYDEDAAKFFSSNFSQPQFSRDAAYDVSTMRAALPLQVQMPTQSPQLHQQHPASDWASDFAVHQQPTQALRLNSIQASEANVHGKLAVTNLNVQPIPHTLLPQGNVHWNPSFNRTNVMSRFASPVPMQAQLQPTIQSPGISWDKEFSNHETQLNFVPSPVQQTEQATHQTPAETDELARTAGLLLDNIKDEQNPKFQQSQFLGLMKKLRDRDIVVEGNQMVENEGQQIASDVKGKGRVVEIPPWHASQMSTNGPITLPSGLMGATFAETARHELASHPEEGKAEGDPNYAYFKQENNEYSHYWNGDHTAITSQAPFANADVASWDHMQSEWDQFEATATGIKAIDNYQFQDRNPYVVGDSSRTRQHMLHTGERQSLSESVLQLEAAVQRDMGDASAWFELGVKQQENEREHKALQALRRAIELNPSHLPTWLALAISHTNEGNRVGTYDAIREWVDRNDRYQTAVAQFQAGSPESTGASIMERYTHLIQCLISMARSDPSGIVDADIQIALAVLLNTNEDYEKAQDCFRTALAVRPEDWLLYNRVGATMANNGHAGDALQYYYRALELNPGYIRARFNLGISCINLRRYEEAAQHILDALVLQDNDGIIDTAGLNEKRGVTSSALWDSLKTTCLHMQRIDLATLCDRKDLETFRNSFHM